MFKLWLLNARLFDAEADAGGSGADTNAGTAAEASAGNASAGTTAPAGSPGQGSQNNANTAAGNAPPALPQEQDGKSGGNENGKAGVNSETYYPDNLPENLRGKTDKETIDRLTKSIIGYRERDAKRNVPKSQEEYYDFSKSNIPEDIKQYFTNMGKDPVFQSLSKMALENGISRDVLHNITTAAYQAAYESGILEPALDVEKERAALLPAGYENSPKEAQDKAIDVRLQANEDFLNLMVKQGKISKEVADNALGMLMDTADGAKFLEIFRNYATGGSYNQPIASGAQAAGGREVKEKELMQRQAELGKLKGTPEYARQSAALDEEYKRFYGE